MTKRESLLRSCVDCRLQLQKQTTVYSPTSINIKCNILCNLNNLSSDYHLWQPLVKQYRVDHRKKNKTFHTFLFCDFQFSIILFQFIFFTRRRLIWTTKHFLQKSQVQAVKSLISQRIATSLLSQSSWAVDSNRNVAWKHFSIINLRTQVAFLRACARFSASHDVRAYFPAIASCSVFLYSWWCSSSLFLNFPHVRNRANALANDLSCLFT